MSHSPVKLFVNHSRSWQENRYVYPVVSRRSKGLSIGVNLNPDKVCNFDCIYCSVDRTTPPVTRDVDLTILSGELDSLLALAQSGEIWRASPFDSAPASLRRLNDIAFSGDGEPTSYPQFGAACEIAAFLLNRRGLAGTVKIIVITNATLFQMPRVAEALRFLDEHHGEIWAKLDAGTEAYYRLVERTSIPLQRVLDNILSAGRGRPIVIQSLFMNVRGAPPEDAEINAYVGRLNDLAAQGCAIKLVQIYTTARNPAEGYVTPLSKHAVDEIVTRVRSIGLAAEAYYGPE